MAKTFDHLLEQLPAERRAAVKARARELAPLKDLSQAVGQTQHDLAVALGVARAGGQHSIQATEDGAGVD